MMFPMFAFSPSQYYDLAYVFSAQPFQHNFRPQGLNRETLPFLFREYDWCAWLVVVAQPCVHDVVAHAGHCLACPSYSPSQCYYSNFLSMFMTMLLCYYSNSCWNGCCNGCCRWYTDFNTCRNSKCKKTATQWAWSTALCSKSSSKRQNWWKCFKTKTFG